MPVRLPPPVLTGRVPLEECLAGRRSVRNFSGQPLSLAEAAQLLWAAQGTTSPEGFRTAPSAGALYPLTIHLVAGRVEDLPAGVYRYHPQSHSLTSTVHADLRAELTGAALGQQAIKSAAASLIMTAVYEKTTWKYGRRGVRYVYMDAGHAAQNICLQAHALGLGTVPIGAFDDREVGRILQLPDDEFPLYILPAGKP